MTMACPQCGSDNDARRRFCNACGVSLERACTGCGFANRSGDRFCGGCGIRLEPVVAPEPVVEPRGDPPAAPEAAVTVEQAKRDELRTITVMMADLDGFGAMTDRFGRERQTAVMNEVFERLAKKHIVDRFDGYIDKFLDGDIMALFGAPIAHEDAPERAVRAAVRMHQELLALHEEGVIPAETPLRLRIGLNTGPVRVGGVGAGGRMEYTAMGDTVNLSARLMTACEWGQSLISSNTHRRVARSFELTALEPVRVKGKSEPVPIWAVVAERRRAARVEVAQEEGMSRLVGREDLLATILEAYETAIDGAGRVVGIRGEAGIGKSRLVFELQQRVLTDQARCVEGRCLSYGVDISYLPLRDVLNELFGLVDADSEETRLEKIRGVLVQHGLEPETYGPPIGWIYNFDFGQREFNQLDPQERRQRVRDDTVAVIQALAKAQPTVLFLDDLQWADADSLDILEGLVAQAPAAPLFVLLAYRPDFQHEYERFEHCRIVAPPRLTLEQTRQMVGSLLAQRELIEDETRVEDSLVEAVHNKAQGNPFFVDQTVTALVERANQTGQPTIDFRRGRLLISEEELGSLVPDSVEEILLSRIDRLPEGPRSLLQAASVAMIGRYFRRSALEFCVGRDGLDALLGALVDRELVRIANETEQDTEYVFEHALARDVAYNNLLKAERRRLHGLVGSYIEDHYAKSVSAYLDDLSYHYYNSAKAEKAIHYLPQSAARAAQTFNNPQAILHYKRALEKADEIGRDGGPESLPRVRLEVLKGLTGVQSLIGDLDGLSYGQQRLELARELADGAAVIDASYMLADQHTKFGQFVEAEAAWEQVRAEYQAAAAWDGVRDSEYGIGNLCYLQGRFEEALEHFQRALEIQVEQMEFEPFGQWVAHNNLAAAQEAMGRFEAVLEACRVCEDLLAKMPENDPMRVRLECYTKGNLGSAHRNLGNLREAIQAYRRTLEISRSTGEKGVEAEVRHWLGRTLLLMGRLREARQHLDESVALATETSSARWSAGSLAAMAELLLWVGDREGSRGLLERARALLEQVGELAGADEVGLVEALWHRHNGEPEIAREILQRVLAETDQNHSLAGFAAAAVELARAEEELGDPTAAAEHVDEALARCAELGLKPIQVRGLLLRARLNPAPDEARAALDLALELAAAMPAPRDMIAILAARAQLSASEEPELARGDLARADELLDELAVDAGDDFVTATRQRYLAPVAAGLATP